MEDQTATHATVYEQAIVNVVRALSARRAAQVLDFARWLQTQAQPDNDSAQDDLLDDDDMERDEQIWENSYLASREKFRLMAREAIAEFEAGATLEMIIEDGQVKAQ